MKYEYWLANIKGIGNRQKREIRASIKSAEELYYIDEKKLETFIEDKNVKSTIIKSIRDWQIDQEYEKLVRKNVRFISIFDKDYPERLKHITSWPYALYVKGELPKEDTLSIAIVGARKCSPYGAAMARDFAKELTENDIQIISGMALGIDGYAQKAALENGGKSFGVLGNGVDICYPRENFELYMQLTEKGGLISEQPLGMQPFKNFFPARNRIISGLSDIILVIEAQEKSGSLITADLALEQGKDVYALPGNVTSGLSKGCHNLIKQGAGILLSPQEFLEELGIFHKSKIKKVTENKKLLETEENIVYSCLDFEPKNPDQISKKTGLSIKKVVNNLINLELKGYIREVSKNNYVKQK